MSIYSNYCQILYISKNRREISVGLQHDYGNKGEPPIEDNYDDDNIPEIDLPQGARNDKGKNILINND